MPWCSTASCCCSLGTAILGFDSDFTVPVFHFRFWQGGFFLGYKLVLDLAGVMLLAGLGTLGANRFIRRPERLDYRQPPLAVGERDRALYRLGDRVFVSTLAFLAVTGFLLEGLALAQAPPSWAGWSPVGWVLMKLFVAIGLHGSSAGVAHHVVWWIHGLAALSFVASIPFTKAVHMLAAPANVTVRNPEAGKQLVGLAPDAAPEEVGYALDHRPVLEAPVVARCLHQVRQVHRGLPSGRRRPPALAPRPHLGSPRVRRRCARCPRRPVAPTARRPGQHRDRPSDPARDHLVVHPVHGVRRDLPRRDRACPDHQPDAPPARRAGQHGPAAAVDPGDGVQLGELLRGGQAQAWALDRRARPAR